jgi:hypothetical protein
MYLRETGWDLDRTGSRSSQITSLCINGIEPSCTALTNHMQQTSSSEANNSDFLRTPSKKSHLWPVV